MFETYNMSNKKNPKFNQYVDPLGGISSSDLKRAEWFQQHRETIKHAVYGAVIFLVSTVFITGLIGWGNYIIFGTAQDTQLWSDTVNSVANHVPLQKFYKPIPLDANNVTVTPAAKERFDFGAMIKNDNTRKIAEITYHFNFAGGETINNTAKILPKSERPIVVFGHRSNRFPTNAELIIDNITWTEIDPHQLFDIKTHMADRLELEFDELEFLAQNPDKDRSAHSIKFRAKNNSTYSYWNLPLLIRLKRGNQTSGYIQTKLREFKANEERRVDLRSLAPNLFASEFEVYPIDNVFEEKVFMPPQVIR